MKRIDSAVIADAMTYADYRSLVNKLLIQDKATGDNHSEAMLHYTRLNVSRMNRLDKKTQLSEGIIVRLHAFQRPVTLLVISEGWCGDAAQSLPVIHKMVEASDQLSMRIILRDQHLDIMDAFLTNGGRSIPKVIFLDDESGEVLGSWGPRPEVLQAIVTKGREATEHIEDAEQKKAAYQSLVVDAQKWYTRDKTKSIQEEVMTVLEKNIAITA